MITLHLLVSAAVLGSSYALVGIGYNLAFSTMRVINFAQGEMFMVGGMLYAAMAASHWNLWVAFVTGAVVAGLLGAAIERFMITPIMRQGFTHGNVQAALLGTVAAGIVITEAARRIWGDEERRAIPLFGTGVVNIHGFVVGIDQLTVIGGAALCMISVWFILHRTSLGLHIRATAADPTTTLLQGINYRTVSTLSFFIGGVVTGIAGILVSALTSVSPSSGTLLSIYGVLAALLGGLGRIGRVIPAGLAIGIVQVFSQYYWSNQYGDLVTFGIIFVVLVAPRLWDVLSGAARSVFVRAEVPG